MEKAKRDAAVRQNKTLEKDFPIKLSRETVRQNCVLHTGMHWHDTMELVYVRSGSIKITCGTRRETAYMGDLVLIRPGEAHYILAGSEIADYYCISAAPEFFHEAGLHLEYTHLPLLVSTEADKRPGSLAQELIEEIENRMPGYGAMARTLMVQLIVCLMRDSNASSDIIQRDNRKIRMIKEALNYIEENYTNEITVDAICSHIGFSKYYFCRTFKEITGKTAVEHLNMVRCQKAHDLIALEKYNVKQAAELSGFHNQQYFCKVYKKYAGYLPSQIKKIRPAACQTA